MKKLQLYPTASSLERAEKCPASFYLSQVNVESEPAEKGTNVHRFLQLLGQGKTMAEALQAIDARWRPLCQLIDVEKLPIGPGFSVEVKYAWDILTGKARRIVLLGAREYGKLSACELAGSADVVGVLGDAVVVADYKTGWHVTPLERNLQMRFLAGAAAAEAGKERAIVMLAFLHDDGTSWLEQQELDEFDLLAIKKQMADIYRSLPPEAESPAMTEGEHCRHCPAYSHCPQKMTLALALGNKPLMERWEAKALEGAATEAYHQWKHAKEVLDRIGQNLFGFARQHPFPVGDGKILGETVSERRSIDGEAAWDAISALHGVEVARKAVTIGATFSSVKDALLPLVTKERKISKLQAEAEAAIAERKGITVKKTTTVRVHSPKEK